MYHPINNLLITRPALKITNTSLCAFNFKLNTENRRFLMSLLFKA